MNYAGHVRLAGPADAAACADIYAHYVSTTAISMETSPPSVLEMEQRITRALRKHAWFVLEHDGHIRGFAYGSEFRPRPGYRWTSEVSVYLASDARGAGAGRRLYEALLTRLDERGYHSVMAGIAQPNLPSERFHLSLGFIAIGTFPKAAWKNSTWYDITWMHRELSTEPPSEPAEII